MCGCKGSGARLAGRRTEGGAIRRMRGSEKVRVRKKRVKRGIQMYFDEGLRTKKSDGKTG